MTKFKKGILLLLVWDILLWVLSILDLCGIRFPWLSASSATPMWFVTLVLITISLVMLLLQDRKRERERE